MDDSEFSGYGSSGMIGGMEYHIISDNMLTYNKAKRRLLEEAPKILEEWTYYLYSVNRSEIHTWLKENCSGEFRAPGIVIEDEGYEICVVGAFFKEEVDAMAFKLAWS